MDSLASQESSRSDASPGELVALLQRQHLCPSRGFGEVEGGCAAVALLGDKRRVSTGAPGQYHGAERGWARGGQCGEACPISPSPSMVQSRSNSRHMKCFLGTAQCPGHCLDSLGPSSSMGQGGYWHIPKLTLQQPLMGCSPSLFPVPLRPC